MKVIIFLEQKYSNFKNNSLWGWPCGQAVNFTAPLRRPRDSLVQIDLFSQQCSAIALTFVCWAACPKRASLFLWSGTIKPIAEESGHATEPAFFLKLLCK